MRGTERARRTWSRVTGKLPLPPLELRELGPHHRAPELAIRRAQLGAGRPQELAHAVELARREHPLEPDGGVIPGQLAADELAHHLGRPRRQEIGERLLVGGGREIRKGGEQSQRVTAGVVSTLAPGRRGGSGLGRGEV